MLVSRMVVAALMLTMPATASPIGEALLLKGAARPHVARAEFTAREVRRLRAHFDSVELELRANTPTTLRESQRAARDTVIVWLREYRNAGRFPENDRFAARMVPFFVDHRGVRCAMGELIHRSGRSDIVQAVATTRNNAYFHDLADDPRLVAWLDSVGLTVAEAARVQPAYDWGGGNVIDDVRVTPASGTYKGIATALSVSSLAAVVLNARRPSGLSAWAGLVLGTAGIVSGSLRREDAVSGEDTFTAASIAFGTFSFVAGAYRAFKPKVKPASSSVSTSRISDVQLAPVLLPMGGGRRHAGLAMHAAF